MQLYKIGGNELNQPGFLEGLAGVVGQSKEPITIVHGGGKAIADLQARLGLETIKVDGLRVTDEDSLMVAQMVLSGLANKQIVAALLASGVDAVGLSGIDGGLFRCHKKSHPLADLGYVGEIIHVRSDIIHHFIAQGITAVISPISLGQDGQIYNVNADEAASALALAIEADLINFISNVPGVLQDEKVIPCLSYEQTKRLIATGVIQDGMIPKVQAALDAIHKGVPQARIVDLAGLTQSAGTFFNL